MILNCNILRDFGREIGGMEEEFQLMFLASEIVDGTFKYFKIEGRTWDRVDLIATYAYYMVKPEHQYHFMCMMLA